MVDIIPGNIIGSGISGLTRTSGNDPKEGGLSFVNMIKSGIEDVRSAQSTSEKLTADALMGKADLTEVVQSVAKAEVMLQTMVSIRDRLLSAYQEIMNTRI